MERRYYLCNSMYSHFEDATSQEKTEKTLVFALDELYMGKLKTNQRNI